MFLGSWIPVLTGLIYCDYFIWEFIYRDLFIEKLFKVNIDGEIFNLIKLLWNFHIVILYQQVFWSSVDLLLVFCWSFIDLLVDLLLVFCWCSVVLLLFFCWSSAGLLSIHTALLLLYIELFYPSDSVLLFISIVFVCVLFWSIFICVFYLADFSLCVFLVCYCLCVFLVCFSPSVFVCVFFPSVFLCMFFLSASLVCLYSLFGTLLLFNAGVSNVNFSCIEISLHFTDLLL